MAHTPLERPRERVFRYVRDRLLAGQPPTVREVQQRFGFRAVESAHRQLAALVAAGRLEQDVGKARGYRLPGSDAGTRVRVPASVG